MSPEREEQWRADLEAWPNNANTDSESEWDSDFDPIDQDEINDLLNEEDPNPVVTRTPRTYRGVEIVPDTLPEAETAGVVEGRPRRGPKPVTHFVSFDALMAKSKLDKDMLNKRYLGKEVRAPPRMKFGGATWDELEQCHNMFKAPLSATVDQE